MTVFFKLFGDDAVYTFGTFASDALIAVVVAGLTARPNVSQVWFSA